MSATPTTCAAVNFDMRDGSYGRADHWAAGIGALLWNPKMGAGHVLVAEARCGTRRAGRAVDCGCGGWGMQPCPSLTLICECGQDGSWRDHHYVILRAK